MTPMDDVIGFFSTKCNYLRVHISGRGWMIFHLSIVTSIFIFFFVNRISFYFSISYKNDNVMFIIIVFY